MCVCVCGGGFILVLSLKEWAGLMCLKIEFTIVILNRVVNHDVPYIDAFHRS